MLFGAVEGWGSKISNKFLKWVGPASSVSEHLDGTEAPGNLDKSCNMLQRHDHVDSMRIWHRLCEICSTRLVPTFQMLRLEKNLFSQCLRSSSEQNGSQHLTCTKSHWPHDFSCLHALSGLCRNHGTARSILRRSNSKSLRSIKLLDGSSWHCSNARVDINPKTRKVKTTQKHGVYYGTDYTYSYNANICELPWLMTSHDQEWTVQTLWTSPRSEQALRPFRPFIA